MEKEVKVALTALGVRLLFAPFFAHLWDTNTLQVSLDGLVRGIDPYLLMAQRSSALTIQSGVPVGFQGYDYLPSAFLILLPFYRIYLLLGGNPAPILGLTDITNQFTTVSFSTDVNLFLLFLKLPIAAADAGVTYILARRDLGVARLYAFSPYAILVSAVWGNFDAFVALFLLLSILSTRSSPRLTGLFYGLSTMKLYTAILMPVFAVQMWRDSRRSGVLNFALGFAVSQIPTLYWLLIDSKSMIADLVIYNATRGGGGITPLNVLWTITNLSFVSGTTEFAFVVFAWAYSVALFAVLRRRLTLIESAIVLLATYLMFGVVVNEQYLLALLPLLLLHFRRYARSLARTALVFSMVNSTPVYFAIPLLYGLNLSWFVPQFFNFLGLMPVFIVRSLFLVAIGVYFFLTNFDLVRSTITRQRDASTELESSEPIRLHGEEKKAS